MIIERGAVKFKLFFQGIEGKVQANGQLKHAVIGKTHVEGEISAEGFKVTGDRAAILNNLSAESAISKRSVIVQQLSDTPLKGYHYRFLPKQHMENI